MVSPRDGGGVHEALAVLADKEIDVLAVNGGDGTLQRALTEILSGGLFKRLPLIAPLRSGRTSMVALDIGSHRDPVKALGRLLRDADGGSLAERIVERAVLRVDTGDECRPQYGMFCGFGVIHRAIHLTHKIFPRGRSQGVLGSTLVTGALAARMSFGSSDPILEPDAMQIVLDDRPIEARRFKMVIATTLGRLFFRLHPFWGSEDAPVRFTALEPDATSGPLSVLRFAYGQAPRMNGTGAAATSHNIRHGELRIDCGMTIDGELYDPRPGRVVRIDADDRLRFVRS